jgi:hypothetical protein
MICQTETALQLINGLALHSAIMALLTQLELRSKKKENDIEANNV